MRFVLEPNDVQPISFDLTMSAVTPPFFEDRNLVRNHSTGRVDVNVIRYHQGGWVSGTVTVDGTTHEVTPLEWFGYRDHSWGVRQAVGAPSTDLIRPAAAARPASAPSRGGMKWSPSFFRRPDGTYYETAIFLTQGAWDYSSAYINEASGRQQPVRSVEPRLFYDPRTRFVVGGELLLTMESGQDRIIEVETVGNSGFSLKTSGYGAWAGHIHGAWRGALDLDGEYIADCWDDEHLRSLGQFRDTPIRVREGDAVGYGIMENIMGSVWPELGLTAESDHKVSYS